jgi:DNA-binding response OmpR family regulator
MAQPGIAPVTVLLVEDEAVVRNLVRTILDQQGYQVLEAADGPAAEQLSASHPGTIHLLISDLALPRLTGPTLAARLTAQRPGMKVLFLSGYTAEEAVRAGLLQPGSPFLQKPFGPAALLAKVREVLGTAG